jgi:hypothetical protein
MIFITLTNSGYINYTLNCIESLKKINFKDDLYIYCIGKEGYNVLKDKGHNCSLIDEEKNSNFQNFREGNWSNITYHKFTIIYENLLKHDYVCFTDGDIVFENNTFLKYLQDNIKDNDMIIQQDGVTDKNYLCSGFIFIKSNQKMINLFNPINVEKFKNIIGWDDQVYINNIKKYIKFQTLPLELFPNGLYYYKNSNQKDLKPYLIHFNWVIGHNKKEKMIEYNKWFI